MKEELQEIMIESFIKRERMLVETLEEKKRKSTELMKKEKWKSWKQFVLRREAEGLRNITKKSTGADIREPQRKRLRKFK